MGKVADPLREYVKTEGTLDAKVENDLLRIADQIDRDHAVRMEQCRRETKRATLHYIRACANDYERGIKRVRKQ